MAKRLLANTSEVPRLYCLLLDGFPQTGLIGFSTRFRPPSQTLSDVPPPSGVRPTVQQVVVGRIGIPFFIDWQSGLMSVYSPACYFKRSMEERESASDDETGLTI